MKKLLLPILAAAFLFYGCTKTTTTKTLSGSIAGKWYLSVDSAAIYENGTLVSSSRNVSDHTSYIVYNNDGSGAAYDFTEKPYDTTAFTYKVSGTNITMNYPKHTYDNVTVDPYTMNGTIRTLTSSALETYFEADSTANGENVKLVVLYDFNK